MDKNKAKQLLEKAYENLDVNLLKEAIALGADVNQLDKCGEETLFEEMVCEFGCSAAWGERDERYLGDNLIEFTDVLLENGLDLNHYYHDGLETVSTFHEVSRWGHNKRFLEYLLQHGMDPNIIGEDDCHTAWEELDEDIFLEECCGYPNYAAWFYNAGRLAIGYGAKPICILRPEKDERPLEMVEAARNLDCDKLKEISGDDMVKYELGRECTYYSKFVNGHEFYFNGKEFDRRLSKALDVIIDKIGVQNLEKHALLDCVEGQFPQTLEHLLERGANPNTNCFTKSYSWVKSSALYELDRRGSYIEDQFIANAMREALVNRGAVIK